MTRYRLFKILIAILMLTSAGNAAAQYAAHSVLAEGEWWKIGIAEEGIYRLGPDDADALAGCAVADIALYGHRSGPLATTNGSWRPDDLAEMPIQIVDQNGNGTFDANDYLLFYATGAVTWDYSTDLQRFVHTNHPYAKLNYVYLTISSGEHRRIAEHQQLTPSGDIISTCHSVALHENDLTNTHQTGQIWVGERFNSSTPSRNIGLTLPAAPTGGVKVRYALATVSTAASAFDIALNGTVRNVRFNSGARHTTTLEEFAGSSSPTLTFTLTYSYAESMAAGYLDYIEVDALTPMAMSGSFTAMRTEAIGATAKRYRVEGTSSQTRVWDVTEYNGVVEMPVTRSGSTLTFDGIADTWRTYIAFNSSAFRTPASISRLANQDLHGAANPELLIVCHPSLRAQAERLASLHSINDDLATLVVTQDEVFNEFSSGQRDPIAIRELLRMFRTRAQNNATLAAPRHLLLFGKGTYDNKNLLDNDLTTVVTYETAASFDNDGLSMGTDDIMTYLDDGEGLSLSSTMDVSVGRLPAKNAAEAAHLVDKIEGYMMRRDLMQEGIRGDWRNCVALLADDADPSCSGDTAFTHSSEFIARRITAQYPQFTVDKIYADAYVQQSGADGSFYPDVNNALKKRMDYGCLLLNYIGHGSSQYIGTERFMMKSHISTYANRLQLPFFITSTCTFGRFDDPGETCGAEEFLLADGAGIACLAASRPISHVQEVNADMVLQALNPANTIGDAIRIAKNNRTTTQALTLMGDPALRLSHPRHSVVVTAVNGRPVDSLRADTALVLSEVTIEGEIQDAEGLLVDDFDGIIYPEVYDRPRQTRTLANDNDGCEVDFTMQNSLLYKGSTTVSGGHFRYQFTVPRDVAYKFDKARLAHYAKSASDDAAGAYGNLWLGGFDESVDIRETRPEIRLFMNDTNFHNGGITDANPTLLALLSDSIGINAVGSGLGHDITALIDDNPNNLIILNDFYETDINDERLGIIRYNLTGLAAGRHTITLKAWNIFNYSSNAEIVFYVHGTDTTTTRFDAEPNPASDHTRLRLEHNCKGTVASITLEIYDMMGHRVKGCTPPVSADGYVAGPVDWDLVSDGGTRVSPGVYIARFTITTQDGERIADQGKIIVK